MSKIYMYRNNKTLSIETYNKMASIVESLGYEIVSELTSDTELIACIGGDGTLLSMLHRLDFPEIPILGVNTGHLGFFQDASPDDIEDILTKFKNNEYKLQTIRPIEAKITTATETYTRTGINELLIRGPFSHVSQYEIKIGDTKIQDLSGDGVLVSTPVGSTAYNYSLDGSIVAPDLNVLQLTPVAPMNTNAYRCFHSSIILPADQRITVTGIGRSANGTVVISFDGRTHEFNRVSKIEITQSDTTISLIRFQNYDYWKKLTTKLL